MQLVIIVFWEYGHREIYRKIPVKKYTKVARKYNYLRTKLKLNIVLLKLLILEFVWQDIKL